MACRTRFRPGRERCARLGRFAGGATVRRAERRLPQDTPTERQLDRTHPVGEEAIVPHALETTGQDMQQKPSDEFDGLQRHDALPILPLIVFPSERDLAVVTRQQPPIGDGDAMGVAGEVAEHLLWPGQWGLGVDHPIYIKLSLSSWPCGLQ
jgi:hypothetical protein